MTQIMQSPPVQCMELQQRAVNDLDGSQIQLCPEFTALKKERRALGHVRLLWPLVDGEGQPHHKSS